MKRGVAPAGSEREEEIRQRQAQCYELHLKGVPLKEIARQVGYRTHTTARHAITQEAKRRKPQLSEAEKRDLESARLDLILGKAFDLLEDPETTTDGIKAVLNIAKRRAALEDLDLRGKDYNMGAEATAIAFMRWWKLIQQNAPGEVVQAIGMAMRTDPVLNSLSSNTIEASAYEEDEFVDEIEESVDDDELAGGGTILAFPGGDEVFEEDAEGADGAGEDTESGVDGGPDGGLDADQRGAVPGPAVPGGGASPDAEPRGEGEDGALLPHERHPESPPAAGEGHEGSVGPPPEPGPPEPEEGAEPPRSRHPSLGLLRDIPRRT
jgi:hypothetical protein